MNKVFTFISTTLTVLVTPPIKVVFFLGCSISHLSFALLNVGKKITFLAKNCFSTSSNHSNIPNNIQEEESLLCKFKVTSNPVALSGDKETKRGEDDKVNEGIRNINNICHNLDISSKEKVEEINEEKILLEKNLDPNEEYKKTLQSLKNEKNRTQDLLEKSLNYEASLDKKPEVSHDIKKELKLFIDELLSKEYSEFLRLETRI